MTSNAQQWINSQQDSLLEQMLSLSEINSGTANLAGLARTQNAFESLLQPLGDSVSVIESKSVERVDIHGESVFEKYGNILSCQRRPDAPLQVLLVGHMDTVFPKDHHFQRPKVGDKGTVNGPGVADMKGGILVMLTALQAFEASNNSNQLGWRVILNADEETGSHGSADVLVDAAKNAHAGMIFEPALPDGTLAGARKGSGNFTLVVHGLAAHAGREFAKGRNAIVLASEIAQALASLSNLEKGITVNIARINGGTVFNVVPDQAVCQFNIRCETAADQVDLSEKLKEIEAEFSAREGFNVKLSGTFTRPPKVITPANKLLMEWTQECGQQLNVDINFVNTGGCCDGNNLAAAGLPNIDTLGVLGAHIHTDKEFMIIDSLSQRANLSYLLLDKLAKSADQLLQARDRTK